MKLHISDDLKLPLDAVTQTIAILARKRVGKTYTASVLAEEFIDAKIPIVVLDPTGAWWGLRSSADGKSEGYPVIIIGGGHADVPLEDTAGKVIADLVVDHPGFYVIDFSQLESDAAVQRFACEFAKRFYFRKEQKRFPVHLFIDEADVFIPQNPFGEEKRMLHAFDVIVRRGGIRGIGVTMITQRPAVLNKNVLTQCETLIALQISGSQDVDAIEHWTRLHGSKEQRAEFLSTVGGLQMGIAWVWSPSWLQIFKQVHIRQRRTFNSSATPKAGEKALVPAKLAAIDVEKLGAEIKATIEKVKENDPATLKAENARLKRELAVRPEAKSEIKEVSVLSDADRKLLNRVIDESCGKVIESFEKLQSRTSESIADMKRFFEPIRAKLSTALPQRAVQPRVSGSVSAARAVTVNPRPAPSQFNGDLGRCERAILSALAQYPQGRSANQVAILSGYSANSGGFNNSLSKLRSSDYITRGNPIQITNIGANALGAYDPLPVGDELISYWLSKLGKCEREIFKCLTDNYPKQMTSEEISALTGYSANSGGFNNSLSKLRTLELITRGQPISASPEFFT